MSRRSIQLGRIWAASGQHLPTSSLGVPGNTLTSDDLLDYPTRLLAHDALFVVSLGFGGHIHSPE
jgi:hypothetical protein